MGKLYLFVPPTSGQYNSNTLEKQSTILSYPLLDPALEVGDSLLLVHSKGTTYEAAWPVVARVVQVNRQSSTATLEIEKVYNKKVPVEVF